ncbi:MAG: hypothetical protein BIFFINMI_02905 [Phycisphaerae bacterium]|nr:hypothetical protein [Phycisphaerae bacterium]
MSASLTEIAGDQTAALLAEVVDRNYPITLELKLGSVWTRYKSRFLGQQTGRRPVLWIELPQKLEDNQSISLDAGQKLVASFTHSQERYRFVTAVLGGGDFELAGGLKTGGLRVSPPVAIQRVQRRSHFRYEIPLRAPIDVALWDGGHALREQVDKGTRPLYRAKLVDLSLGGARLRLLGGADPRLGAEDIIGMVFKLDSNGPELALDGRVCRVVRPPGSGIEMGIRFAGLGETAGGRQTLEYLSRALAEMERRTIRRLRMGLS